MSRLMGRPSQRNLSSLVDTRVRTRTLLPMTTTKATRSQIKALNLALQVVCQELETCTTRAMRLSVQGRIVDLRRQLTAAQASRVPASVRSGIGIARARRVTTAEGRKGKVLDIVGMCAHIRWDIGPNSVVRIDTLSLDPVRRPAR